MEDANRIPVVNVVDPKIEAKGIDLSALTGALTGPGSQLDPDDGQLEYISMPSDMSTFKQPIVPEPDEVGDVSKAIALLEKVASVMNTYSSSGKERMFDLSPLDDSSLSLVNQLLGVGEVSITIDDKAKVLVQESVMAGLWRVQHLDAQEAVIGDFIEIAEIPAIVKQMSFKESAPFVDKSDKGLPQGTINSPSMLVELADAGSNWQAGDPAHVLNLSLIPLSPEDVLVLGERLGVGPVTVLSRGYGNCRIGSTNCNNVWWIKYFNSEDKLILNTIEVVDVPEVAKAAAEDIADSAHRLKEILEIYQ